MAGVRRFPEKSLTILAIGATYPAGKLPIARINRLFGRDPDEPILVAVRHRSTRTEMEVSHQSNEHKSPQDGRCSLYFSAARTRFSRFMECVARPQDAISEVIVSELVFDDITFHTILGFHIHPRDEEEGRDGRR